MRGASLGPKLVIPTAAVTIATALVMLSIASSQLERGRSAGFVSKGEAIALALTYIAEQSLDNVAALQAAVDSSKLSRGVAYIFVEDGEGGVLAHTFSPTFPEALQKKNVLDPSGISGQHRTQVNLAIDETWAGGVLHVMDIAAPISGGALGVVHVGMDRFLVEHDVEDLQRRMLLYGSLVAIAGILIGAVITFRVVIRPVRELIRATQVIIADGDLTQPIRVSSDDELGQLARSFSAMVGKLRVVLNNLRSANDTLGGLMTELRSLAEEQAHNASQQAAALQETHVTAQEIRQTSRLAAEKADTVLQDAERADQVSRKGELAIERSLSGLTDIRAQVDEIAGRIGELSTRAAQIAGITETVKDLADQSNMLALNAAIEAVRSGEHGKGFAVVAKEIRALADQSIAATRRVGEVLNDIGASIGKVVAITQAGSQRIDAGLEQVRASGKNLEELSAIVRENSASARQIAAAVSQQNAGVAQVFEAMGDLSRMMAETMRSIEATSAAANQLGVVSSGAAEAVRGYRV
jgi:methyl-accepting chemotaxis protein